VAGANVENSSILASNLKQTLNWKDSVGKFRCEMRFGFWFAFHQCISETHYRKMVSIVLLLMLAPILAAIAACSIPMELLCFIGTGRSGWWA
jgi:hypothetical protein